MPTQSVATVLLKHPNKLTKVYLTAHLCSTSLGNSHRDSGTNSTEVQDQDFAQKSSATARLARFLAELNPDGAGSFDSTCLVTHDWKPTCSQHHMSPASHQQSKTCQPHHSSVLQAFLQQSPTACGAKQLKNQWLAPIVAVFTAPGSGSTQHLCLVQRSRHSLGDALRFSPAALQDDALCRLILFQLLSCLQSLHAQDLYHGDLKSDTIWLAADRSAL